VGLGKRRFYPLVSRSVLLGSRFQSLEVVAISFDGRGHEFHGDVSDDSSVQGLALEGRRDPRPRPFLVNAVRHSHPDPLDDLLLDVSKKGFHSTLALLGLSNTPRTIVCRASSVETIQEADTSSATRFLYFTHSARLENELSVF
jgi:hypothetical protein